jgi:hypothetical protein
MTEELLSLHSYAMWELEPLPPGRSAVECSWLFKVKRDAKGNIERYKTRLVAKGFLQQPGVDLNQVWAPVRTPHFVVCWLLLMIRT